MLDSFIFSVFVGTILGLLAGLGTGGGSLLILWLTLILNTEPEIARGINLLFFIPSALIACFFRRKQGVLPFRKIIPAVITGCIAAGIFTFIGRKLDTEILKKMFGALLLFVGIKELLYRPKKAK